MSDVMRGLSDALKGIQWKKCGFAAAAYLVAALVLFYPLTTNMGTVMPGFGGDSYQNLWNIWWVGYALLNLHTSIYYTNLLFFPIGANLVEQTMSPLLALISLPFQALGTIFAYNVVFLLSFVLSGLGMMVLARYVTKSDYAAFFAGIVFAFSSFHIAQADAHIHFVNIMFVPLFMYFLLKTIDKNRRIDALGMAVSFAGSALIGSTQQAVMLAVLFVATIVAYLAFSKNRKKLLSVQFASNMALFVVLAFVIGIWLFLPEAVAMLSGGLSSVNYLNDVQHNELWSSDLLSFFTPSYYNGLFNWLTKGTYNTIYAGNPTERAAYLSFTALMLTCYCIYKQRRHAAPWVAGLILFALLALGPQMEFNGAVSVVPSIYYIYHAIPGINIIREPGRFNLLVTMFLAVLSAMGLKLLLDRGEADKKSILNNKLLVVGAISVLFLIESNGMPMFNHSILQLVSTQVSVPKLYPLLATMKGNFSVLALPAVTTNTSISIGKSTYYTSITHKPLVGGYVTRTNNTELLDIYNIPLVLQDKDLIDYDNASYASPVVQNYTNQTLLTLFNYNTEFVVVDKSAYNKTTLPVMEGYLASVFNSPVYNDNTTIAFSTAKAINASLFRSFVSYPILTQWQTTLMPFNGTYRQVWSPIQSGAVVVYAPYPNTTNIVQEIRSRTPYGVNATITIRALAPSPTQLYVGEIVENSTRKLALFNLTGNLQTYVVNVTLVSGQMGNTLFFVAGSKTSNVAIMNITVSGQVK
jgi:hypothetical protein